MVGAFFFTLCLQALLIFIMSLLLEWMLKVPPLGKSFALFLSSGYIPYSVFSGITRDIRLLRSCRRLNIAEIAWLSTKICLFRLSVAIAMSTCVSVVFSLPLLWVYVLSGLILAALFGTSWVLVGLALRNSFPVTLHLLRVLRRPMFVTSGILFLCDRFPLSIQYWLWLNPIAQAVAFYRRGIYPGYAAANCEPLNGIAISFLSIVIVIIFIDFLRAPCGQVVANGPQVEAL